MTANKTKLLNLPQACSVLKIEDQDKITKGILFNLFKFAEYTHLNTPFKAKQVTIGDIHAPRNQAGYIFLSPSSTRKEFGMGEDLVEALSVLLKDRVKREALWKNLPTDNEKWRVQADFIRMEEVINSRIGKAWSAIARSFLNREVDDTHIRIEGVALSVENLGYRLGEKSTFWFMVHEDEIRPVIAISNRIAEREKAALGSAAVEKVDSVTSEQVTDETIKALISPLAAFLKIDRVAADELLKSLQNTCKIKNAAKLRTDDEIQSIKVNGVDISLSGFHFDDQGKLQALSKNLRLQLLEAASLPEQAPKNKEWVIFDLYGGTSLAKKFGSSKLVQQIIKDIRNEYDSQKKIGVGKKPSEIEAGNVVMDGYVFTPDMLRAYYVPYSKAYKLHINPAGMEVLGALIESRKQRQANQEAGLSEKNWTTQVKRSQSFRNK